MTVPKQHWQIAYNGWTWSERCSVIPIQNAAYRSGVLPRPTQCCICLMKGTVWKDGRAQFIGHLERYDRPLEIYPVCRRCHASLHARFADPARWQRVLTQHGRLGQWVTLLSMDVASQWRPFDETYPDGLPLPTADIRRDLFS